MRTRKFVSAATAVNALRQAVAYVAVADDGTLWDFAGGGWVRLPDLPGDGRERRDALSVALSVSADLSLYVLAAVATDGTAWHYEGGGWCRIADLPAEEAEG